MTKLLSSGHVYNESDMNTLHDQQQRNEQQNTNFAPTNPREITQQNFRGGSSQNTPRLRRNGTTNIPLIDQQPIRGNNQVPDKNAIIHDMKTLAMEELEKLARLRQPLWIPSVVDTTNFELNEEEYFKTFKYGFGPRIQTLTRESSRHYKGFVVDPLVIVGIFMDVTRWKNVFNAVVAKSMVLQILSTGTGEGNHDGKLQVMSVELHTLSPLVPTRSNIIARYCKQLGDGKWGIVDFSVDIFRPGHLIKYRKRPSGCIIEKLHGGSTMMTWIENVEVDNNGIHPYYKPLVNSGLAFGAKRWLGLLEKQIDRFSFAMSKTNLPAEERVVIGLAERMVENYNAAVSLGAGYPWSLVEPKGPYEMRVLIQRNNENPRHPIGIILNAANSFWLNAPPRDVFDYLCNKQTRANWDLLSNNARPYEISNTNIGRDLGSCVSMLQMNGSQMFILQEAIWDPLGAHIIYAPVEVSSLSMVLNGGDPNYVALLPSGFVVVPDGSTSEGIGGGGGSGDGGSLVTVSFQILVDTCPTSILDGRHAEMVTNLVNYTINKLKIAFDNYR